jgi:hypothetical protein
VSLYREDVQTYQAFRLAAAPHVDTVWCRAIPNEANVRGAVATEHGPLLVLTPSALTAVRAQDGQTVWQLPRGASGGPFTLLEAGADWIACDMDIVAIDRDRGAVRWRRSFPPHTAVDCGLDGSRVGFAARRCTAHDCTPAESGVLDVATGAAVPAPPDLGGRRLVAVDPHRVLVENSDGVAVVEAETGSLAARLPLEGHDFRAEALPGGDVLVTNRKHTWRLTSEPLAVRWQVADGYVKRVGDRLIAVRDVLATGGSTIVVIDLATGSERDIPLPSMPPLSGYGYELGGASVLGSAGTEIDVAVGFGYWEH